MSAEEGNTPSQGQATTPAPTSKPAKNPKRVAAGKAAAQKTKEAREAQKKALANAEERAKKAEEKATKAHSAAAGKGGAKIERLRNPPSKHLPKKNRNPIWRA